MESKISEANAHIIIFGWCEHILMGISYYNNLSFKGSRELHVAEIIIILLDVVKQYVRFMTNDSVVANVTNICSL
jgi:hypothetical protein